MRNKKEIVSYSDNRNEIIIYKTKLERILIVMDYLEKRGLNSERVNSVYRKIVNS